MIERVERFVTMGKTFDTPQKAIEFREGLVEEFFRKLPGINTLRAKDWIPFVQAILDRREELTKLLDYEYPAQ